MTDARVSTLMAKAERALAGARLLLTVHNTDGACSRAYYAMFDAAFAAVLWRAPEAEGAAKTHRGLIASFGQRIVVGGLVDPEFGRSLKQVQELRLVADYIGDPISLDQAALAVSQAELFLAEMQRILATVSGP